MTLEPMINNLIATAPPVPVERVIRELHLELTFRCNCRCVMCDLPPQAASAEELTAAELDRMLTGTRLLEGLELIVLSGGEAFLRPDLPEIATLLVRRFPAAQLGILTNGFDPGLIREQLTVLGELPASDRLWLGFSLDGIGSAHDRIRGVPGAFARLEQTLTTVRERWPALRCSFTFTITPENYREIAPAANFAARRGGELSVQFEIPGDHRPTTDWPEEALASVEQQLAEVRTQLARQYQLAPGHFAAPWQRGALSRFFSLSRVVAYQRRPERVFPSCVAGERFAMVAPNGDVYFCPRLKGTVLGNLRRQPLDEVWRAAPAAAARETIARGGCHCFLICTIGPQTERALAAALSPRPSVLPPPGTSRQVSRWLGRWLITLTPTAPPVLSPAAVAVVWAATITRQAAIARGLAGETGGEHVEFADTLRDARRRLRAAPGTRILVTDSTARGRSLAIFFALTRRWYICNYENRWFRVEALPPGRWWPGPAAGDAIRPFLARTGRAALVILAIPIAGVYLLGSAARFLAGLARRGQCDG